MSAGTKIQWADDTANFWRGCTKVSPGCANCYAEKNIGVKMHGIKWGKDAPRVLSKSAFDEARKWNRKPVVCGGCGDLFELRPADELADFECSCGSNSTHRRRVFSLSLGDWLDEEVPIAWLERMLETIHECQNIDFLLLTKRPENFIKRMNEMDPDVIFDTADFVASEWLAGRPPKNVWVGVSVENQAMADKRIPELFKIPSVVRFLSIEPLLGPVDLTRIKLPKDGADDICDVEYNALTGESIVTNSDSPSAYDENDDKIDWIIIGGESGPKARDCDVRWIESLVNQGKSAGVATFVKQLGARPYQSSETEGGTGFFLSLKDKKGGDISEFPAALKVRQFPKAKIFYTDTTD